MTKGSVKLELNPQPVIPTIKLLVTRNLQVGVVFYTEGHTVEVSHREAVKLLESYPDNFEVLQ